MADGKRPYYLKKRNEFMVKKMTMLGDERNLALVEQYEKIKASGTQAQLEKVMEKRRKKNATKDHRHMPYRRRQ